MLGIKTALVEPTDKWFSVPSESGMLQQPVVLSCLHLRECAWQVLQVRRMEPKAKGCLLHWASLALGWGNKGPSAFRVKVIGFHGVREREGLDRRKRLGQGGCRVKNLVYLAL